MHLMVIFSALTRLFLGCDLAVLPDPEDVEATRAKYTRMLRAADDVSRGLLETEKEQQRQLSERLQVRYHTGYK